MRVALTLTLTLTLTLSAQLASAAPTKPTEHVVTTPRGAKVALSLHLPQGTPGKLATLIIAPGQGYHRGLPILKGLAEEAARQGIAALRFDWAYTAAKGRPSAGLKAEREDLEAVLAFAKAHERVDGKRILLAGKSLGTLVVYPAFRSHPELRGLFLLTPVVTWKWGEDGKELPKARSVLAENYPGLSETKRQVVITVGDRDRLCALPMLYAGLSGTKGNVASVVVGGDHGLNLGSWRDEAFKKPNAANVAVAVKATVQWMRIVLEHPRATK
jgi:alpha/beta superfamily hydrolase